MKKGKKREIIKRQEINGIPAVGQFEKVSFAQFEKDLKDLGINMETDVAFNCWDELKLPTRATAGSAGYDFHCPFDVGMKGDGSSVTIPTGIRARIDFRYALIILPRSGLGFKHRMALDNTLALIDSDFYYANNEGHIMLKFHIPKGRDDVALTQGLRFAQGIFIPYGITVDDNATAARVGGFGSTGLK